MKANEQRLNTLFKDIPGYAGLYRINHTGDIQRVFKTCIVTMKPTLKSKQYIVRLMTPNGKRKEERIHKLMQKTFLLPPKPGQVLYHKNGNKKDNWINNLGYISREDLGKKTGGSSRRQAVVKLDGRRDVVEIYPSARQAAKENFMSYQTIMDRCNGNVKKLIAPDGFFYVWDKDIDY